MNRQRIFLFLFSWVLILTACTWSAGVGPGVEKALFDASSQGRSAGVEAALKSGAAINAVDDSGQTALMQSVRGGHIDVVMFLLKQGADVNRVDKSGVSALMLAAQKGESVVVLALLEAGARADLRDNKKRSIFWYARKAPAAANIDGILVEYGAPLDEEKGRGFAEEGASRREVSVHYATNRVAEGKQSDPEKFFGSQSADHLSYGICKVAIPLRHISGEMESPIILFGKFDPKKHVTLLEISSQTKEEFFTALTARQKLNGTKRDLLVFVHGYNVSFGQAARRTAQLTFDLDFPGIPVLFSWPSSEKLFDYSGDRKRINASIPQFKEFLLEMIDRFQPDNVHLIAHSMGSYGLSMALNEVSTELSSRNQGPVFNQVILAAPDIDAEQFRTKIAPFISNTAKRVTLYASSNDLAMVVSRYYNSSGQRVGDSSPEVVVANGIVSVDVSQVDTSLVGHSYYGSNNTVLGDIGEVLRGRSPDARHLDPLGEVNRRYWLFNPFTKRE